jgi:hypothetical protein
MKSIAMRKNLLALTLFNIVVLTSFVEAQTPGGNDPLHTAGSGNSAMIINAFDSVYFDLFQASVVGNIAEVPVYFKSDDIINAVDFNFKYDQTKLEYDTILFMASYIEGLSFYNQNDSVVRLTSYSFTQPYANDSLLFKIRFTLLTGNQICAGDLNTVEALLNGDACTAFVTDCLTGIGESQIFNGVEIYPNPAVSQLNVNFQSDLNVEILDLTGRMVIADYFENQNGSVSIPVGQLMPGNYMSRLRDGEATATKRFVKIR